MRVALGKSKSSRGLNAGQFSFHYLHSADVQPQRLEKESLQMKPQARMYAYVQVGLRQNRTSSIRSCTQKSGPT